MTITTTNQKPVELNSLYLDTLSAPFDPTQAIKDNVVKPLFTPLIPSTPAVIDCDGHPVSEDDITQALFDCSGDRIDPDAEEFMQEVLAQTLTYYDRNLKTLTVQDMYAVQAAKKMGMIMPAPTVIYSTSDVIDTAKQFLSGLAKTEHFFASLAFYAKVQAFGYYFANESAWNEFKNWFNTQITAIQSLLPQETVDLCNQMMNVRLNHLTESFVVRDDDTQNNDPYSFARLFVFYLMQYEQFRQTNNMPEVTAGHLPFSFAENFCPRVIIIVNVEKHAHAHHGEIKNEWDTIKGSMILRPKVLSSNKIASLTAVTRMANKMKGQAAASQQADSARSAIIRFRKTAPTSIDLYKYIMSIYKHTQFVQNSENAFKASKMTYQKASRREPDNPDRQGKTSRTIYRPDLHIYLDCSGSISERQYQDAIKTCIKLAKKMEINFYFNSFSHIMSQTTKLPTKGKTIHEIYDIFKNVPKVGGGTDYEQIWHYINKESKRRREVSIIISDFEWSAPNRAVTHPRFLYYAPISGTSWASITREAERFTRSMLHIEPKIRKHILM